MTETRYVCGCVVTACRFGTMTVQCDAHRAAGQSPPPPVSTCPVHTGTPEPCPSCESMIAAGL